MRSGKQYYCVRQVQKDGSLKNWVHYSITKFRSEEMFQFKKQIKTKIKQRFFVKESSVFAKWKEDD